MSTKTTIELTDRQRGMLRMLVINEARELGYGDEFIEGRYQHMHPHTGWPRRLRDLAAIADKLTIPWS